MLQQTQVATVIDYFNRFIKAYPSVKKLADAELDDVLRLWEGLGYYRRARQLHAAAKEVVKRHRSRFPRDFDSVLALPGIGRYTAGAILSIALDQSHPILEGNTVRLFSRLKGVKTDPRVSANQKRLWTFAEAILPKKRVGDFNQSLMELGSEICRPKNPACLVCPVQAYCEARKLGLQDSIPAKAKKIQYESIRENVVLISRKGKFLIRKCGSGERWEGLWDFPRFETTHSDRPVEKLIDEIRQMTALEVMLEADGTTIKHAVTRYRITLEVYRSTRVRGRLKKLATESRWATPTELAALPMSITGRKIAKQL